MKLQVGIPQRLVKGLARRRVLSQHPVLDRLGPLPGVHVDRPHTAVLAALRQLV